MITVKCLASGSSGNSYAVDDGESALLLEAGIPAKKIAVGFQGILPKVAGCLITHEHQDHARGAAGLARLGIDLYATEGTFFALGDSIAHPFRKQTVHAMQQIKVGSWIVMPWEARHDAAEPVGFLLYSTAAREKLLFATDTYYIPNTFCDLSVILVECNFSLPLLRRNLEAGKIPEALKKRLLQSHFSLEHVRDFLKANDLHAVRRIYLIHLSSGNADPEQFKRDIMRLTGKPVSVF